MWETVATVTRFEDLAAWRTARQLTERVYRLSSSGRLAHDFGLRDQMQRAAVSIMSNIAEGFDSRTPILFREFLGRAKASSGELRSQAYIAVDIGYIEESQLAGLLELTDKCSRQIKRLMDYLSTRGVTNAQRVTRNAQPTRR
jgi:four helix bundle protein